MNTQADTATAVRRSLDSQPGGSEQANIGDDLPEGWAAFCSRPDANSVPGWYAVAPYLVHNVPGGERARLSQTVYASTWPDLHRMVRREVSTYRRLTGGEE